MSYEPLDDDDQAAADAAERTIKLAQAFEHILNGAMKHGPLILEAWQCPRCKVGCHESHRFEEVLSCCNCGQRVASKVPRYRAMMEMLPDNK